MNARYSPIDNRKRTPTGEYLSPWSSQPGWSFNPQNISVFTPQSNKSDTHDSLDRSLRGDRPRRPLTTVEKATIGLLFFSLCVMGMIVAMLFS